ncbi:hypothetical protein B0J12DRAFT_24556 [Macrophomina phaseolina]|uniref:Fucose-specific lectin n=1 Tax=Macrophomina phaseolina TaxID=35725 RepID=A0ABQ8GUY7_9PEZI|nr:hypothetical protein B0J12DRAFT_24556 [Macrophomina phaseolina]
MGPGKPDYSTLEVDERDHTLPEVVVKPNVHDYPEALDTTAKEVVPPTTTGVAAHRSGTICGIRKRNFWILLVLILLIVIGVAVGVGVGVGTSNQSKGDSSAASSTTTSRTGVAANSRLAANNYTDADGFEHSQLYYQDKSLVIYNADYSNATGAWTLKEVVAANNVTDMTPRNGTPIAAGNWFNDVTDSDFRVLWADKNNSIRAVYVLNESISTGWNILPQIDNLFSIDEGSSLVEYLGMCNQTTTCNAADFFGYEAPSSDGIQLEWRYGRGDSGRLSVTSGNSISPDEGTAMAAAPIPKIESRNMSYPIVALYFVQGEALVELRGGADLDWTNTNLKPDGSSVPVDAGAQLAAMTQYRDDDYNIQVLMTKSGGGVKMAYMNGDRWAWTNSVEGMESVMALSPIAANQLGRVYAFENSTAGPQIVEWQRITGDMPTFQRVGSVNTTRS